MKSKKWKSIKGHNHTLIIASHNFPHMRQGKIKKKDISTGNFVKRLCQETKSWGLITTSIQKDPNWYVYSPFRIQTKKLIKDVDIDSVYDIHGRRSKYPNLIEFLPNHSFTRKYNNLIHSLPLKSFRREERLTITEDLDRSGIPCVEIEIRRDARIINSYEFRKVFSQIVRLINKTLN